MKNNYFSSKNSRAIDSRQFKDQLLRNFRNCVGTILLTATPVATLYAQTHPVPQQVPYTQNFDNLTGANPAYPAGWAGWRLDGNLNTNFAALPVGDANFGTGNNNTTAPGIYDMVGKLGFLTSAGVRTAPALSIKTLQKKNIVVKYKINVQRVNSNRGLAIKLQYRLGQEGAFTDVDTSLFEYYGAGTGTNIGTGVAALESHNFEIPLPVATELQPEVQLRWVVARTVNNQGSGDNHSFSIDDVVVQGTTPPDLPVEFPYTDNFNHETWVTNNGTPQANRFKIATPATNSGVTFADNKLFITSNYTDDSSTPTYNSTTSSSYAYKDIILPAGITTARISFKWLAKGESTWDYGRFYLIPATSTAPTNGTNITNNSTTAVTNSIYNARLNRTSNYFYLNEPTFAGTGAFENIAYEYKDNTVNLAAYAGQTVRAVFFWRNDASTQNNPSLIIDDFVFDYTPNCINPTFLATTNIEGRTAQLNWESTASNFEYHLSTTATRPADTATPTGSSQTTSAIATGLTPSTQYYAWVRTVCDGNEKSEWSASTTFTTGVSCVVPTSNNVTDISSNGATLNWSSGNDNFEYYVSTTNTVPTETTAPTGSATSNSVALTQLTPNTTYYWWVRSNCGTVDGKSLWSTTNTFVTGQIPATFPFIENFNTNTNTWTILSNNTGSSDLSKFTINTPDQLTIGSRNLTFADGKLFVTSNSDNLKPIYKANSITYAYRDVALPADLTTAQLSFKWLIKGEGPTYEWDYGRFFIVPLNSQLQTATQLGANPTALNNIYTFNDNPFLTGNYKHFLSNPNGADTAFTGAYETIANVFQNNEVNLAQYAGQTVRVVFYFKSDGSTQNPPSLIIDDFRLTYPPACIEPTQVTSTNITARAADINWTASTSEPANGYEYYYTTSTTAPTATTPATGSATGTTIGLTGLTPETTYNIWVRSLCSTTLKSSWTPAPHSFTTSITCPAPTTPVTTDITQSSATLGWTSTNENFEYVLSTTNTEPTATTEGTAIEGNTVTVSDLNPNTTYYWWVRANCGTEDGKSRWTTSSTFTTNQTPATFPYIDNFNESQWVLVNGTQTNKFYVGTPTTANGVSYADNKLFVSENGTSNTYATTGSSVYAYRDITLPTDLTNAKISFDWIYKGEGGTGTSTPFDYGRFYIVPTSVLPTAGTNLGYTEQITNAIYSLRNNTIPTDRRSYLLYNPAGSYSGAFEDIAHNYSDQIIDLSSYAGQTVRMVFFFRNDSGIYPPSLAIDNFEINYTPNCVAPLQLGVSNISSTTASIAWTGNSTSYNYFVSTTNEDPTSDFNGTTIDTANIDLENLTPNTTYYWWVKSACGDTSSQWVKGPSFTTNKLPQAYPLSDNFDTNNWTIVNGNQTNKFEVGTPDAGDITFTNNALFISNNSTSNAYTITSASATFAFVDVELPSDATTAQVNFNWYAKGESTFDYGRFFIVPTSYNPVAGTAITATGTITNQILGSEKLNLATGTGTTFEAVQSTYLNDEINVSEYAGQTVRLVFYWKNDGSVGTQPPLAVDNFYFGPVRDLSIGDYIKGDFAYYPNPVQNELNIKAEETISSIELYNLAGQAMNQVKLSNKEYKLDTAKLTAGVYIVKVTFENGTSKSVKIIKK